MQKTRSLCLLASCALACAACNKKDSDAAATASSSTEAVREDRPSLRAGLVVHEPLLDEAMRAELDQGGLLIDFGVPGQHKYTRGGWRSGWGKAGIDGTTTWAGLRSRQGFLELAAPRTPPTEIVVRARARTSGQGLSFHIDGRELGHAKLPTKWTVLRVPVAADAMPRDGRFRFEVRAATGGRDGVRAEIDWLWLATTGGEPTITPRIKPLAIAGKTRRALAAPTARGYTFYLAPPAHARLVVDLGAAQRAEFTITATVDGQPPKQLLRTQVSKGWKEQAVELDAYAGHAVRLDLATANQDGEAGWGEPELLVPAPPAPRKPVAAAPPKNVIVVLMDTARADAYGPFGGKDRVAKTPNYDALAARSTVFTAAYDNENWTKPSVATVLTGLYPSTHDTKKDDSKLPADVEMLSEHLHADGFATAGFVANGYVSDHFGFEQGWDEFVNYIRTEQPSEAARVFGDALAWQAAHTKRAPNQPFFLYVQTIDPHVTYRDQGPFTDQYFEGKYSGPLGKSIEAEDQVKLSTKKLAATATDLAWLRALYYGEISYHDAELGKFVDALEARGVLDDTLFVITNDHGEELGERGRFGHGHQVFEELIRAPLLVHYPPLFPAGRNVRDIVEQVDLAPTVLDALQRKPLANADGVSFLPLVRGEPVSRPRYAMTEFLDGRRVLRVGHLKLFARADGSAAVFDLAADPKEEHELADAPIARRLCEILLGETLATPDKATRLQGVGGSRKFRAGEAQISGRMRRQLEALGYFGADPKQEE